MSATIPLKRPPAPPSRARLARNIPLVYAARLLFQIHFLAAISLPFFRDWGGLSVERILQLNAWFFFWVAAFEVPTGGIADRFGRRRSAAAGYAVSALGVAIYLIEPRLELFLLGEMVIAFGIALTSGADEALLVDSLAALDRGGETSRVLAHAQSFRLLGLVIGPLAGTWLNEWLGLRATVACQIAPMTVAALVGLGFAEPPQSGLRPGRRMSWRQLLREGAGHVLHTPQLRTLAFDLIVANALAFTALWLYQPLLEAAGVPVRWFGSVHVGISLAQIAVLQAADRLIQWLGSRHRLVRCLPLGAGIAFASLGVVHSAWLVIALIWMVLGFGLTRAPLLAGAVNAHIPSDRRATALSAISMGSRLTIVCVEALASLGTRFSLHATAFVLGCALIGLALLSRVSPSHLRAQEVP